jgi:hypothetical protein
MKSKDVTNVMTPVILILSVMTLVTALLYSTPIY